MNVIQSFTILYSQFTIPKGEVEKGLLAVEFRAAGPGGAEQFLVIVHHLRVQILWSNDQDRLGREQLAVGLRVQAELEDGPGGRHEGFAEARFGGQDQAVMQGGAGQVPALEGFELEHKNKAEG